MSKRLRKIFEVFAVTFFAILTSSCSHLHVAVPVRPAMPLESVQEGVSIDTFIAACIAEQARREAYEIQLRSALALCNGDLPNDAD